MSADIDNQVTGSEWQVGQLRLTCFPPPGTVASTTGQWENITGQTPDTSNLKARTSEIEELGPVEAGSLIYRSNPARTDWLLVTEANDGPNHEAQRQVSLPEGILSFAPLMHKWISTNHPTCRLAFGADLRLPVKDRAVGYKQISKFLSFLVDPATSKELIYQINRPRIIEIADIGNIEINRLMKWGVAHLRFVQMSISSDGSTAQRVLHDKGYELRLTLDINSSSEHVDAIPMQSLAVLFDKLISLAEEITVRGDCP